MGFASNLHDFEDREVTIHTTDGKALSGTLKVLSSDAIMIHTEMGTPCLVNANSIVWVRAKE